MQPTLELTDWLIRNADYRNPDAAINTNSTYFASEAAAAILAAVTAEDRKRAYDARPQAITITAGA